MTHASPAAISKNLPESRNMLCAKYGRGLKYLINRICPAYAEECFCATIDEVTSSIGTGQVLTDDDLPSLLRRIAREVASTFPSAPLVETVPAVHPQVMLAIQQNFSIFTPVQREALFRYYVNAESPASISEALALDIEEFRLITKAARGIVRLRLGESTQHIMPSGKNGKSGHVITRRHSLRPNGK